MCNIEIRHCHLKGFDKGQDHREGKGKQRKKLEEKKKKKGSKQTKWLEPANRTAEETVTCCHH